MTFANSYRIALHVGKNLHVISTDSIDSITFHSDNELSVHYSDSLSSYIANVDSITTDTLLCDTLFIKYENEKVIIQNYCLNTYHVVTNAENADVNVSIRPTDKEPIISISGESQDGRLCVKSDINYTLCLNGIKLKSSHAPAINSITKQKVKIVLVDGIENHIEDASIYNFADTLEVANGCLSSQGPLTFKGEGALTVCANSKHAIYSKKSIHFKSGSYRVASAPSDAIHSGKGIEVEGGDFNLFGMEGDGFDMDEEYMMTGGNINMNITGIAAKGIKCNGLMTISGGSIKATASGALKNKDGELAYCTILKCDSSAVISGGELNLINNSDGGKCISVDHNINISGGVLKLETHGNGGEYINAEGIKDYYTPKCLSVDKKFVMEGASISCLSTGLGGKGIVISGQATFGKESTSRNNLPPSIYIETHSGCIVNDTIADMRDGCPKALKAKDDINIYDCTMNIKTHGMGGEGIECLGAMFIYNGNIICNTFDDGINVAHKLDVYGGQIYCFSKDNDGIDSNDKMGMLDGLIVSQSGHPLNESFDTEHGNLYVFGGTMFGISPSNVHFISEGIPIYSTPVLTISEDGVRHSGIEVQRGKYYYLTDGNHVMMSMKCEITTDHAFFFITHPKLNINTTYFIIEGEAPQKEDIGILQDKLYSTCNLPTNCKTILTFIPSF